MGGFQKMCKRYVDFKKTQVHGNILNIREKCKGYGREPGKRTFDADHESGVLRIVGRRFLKQKACSVVKQEAWGAGAVTGLWPEAQQTHKINPQNWVALVLITD